MLDLRLPIGLMFSLVGGLLVVYGLWNGIKVDLYWGLFLAIFGLLMWYFSSRAAPSENNTPPTAEK